MFFTPNLVIGLTIMSVGAVLLLDTLGIRDAAQMIRYWPALIVLFGASIVAQAFRSPADPAAPGARRASGVPCFFLFLLGVAMFGSFGFPGSAESRADGRTAVATGIMRRAATLGGADVRSARLAAVMGKSSLDLRRVALAPGDVMTVDVFVAMGNGTVRVPDDWVVDASALPVMGAVEESRFPRPQRGAAADGSPERAGAPDGPVPPPPAGPPPRLRLRGFVMMGKVEVTS